MLSFYATTAKLFYNKRISKQEACFKLDEDHGAQKAAGFSAVPGPRFPMPPVLKAQLHGLLRSQWVPSLCEDAVKASGCLAMAGSKSMPRSVAQ